MPEERSKAAGAGIVGAGIGLGAGLALRPRRALAATESEKLDIILQDIGEIKQVSVATSGVLSKLTDVLTLLAAKPVEERFPDLPPYNVRKFELDTAKTTADPEEVDLPGDALTFYTNGDKSGIQFALDSPTNDWITVGEFGNPYSYPATFERFYLAWTAQAGRYLRVHIGREAGAAAAVEITASTPKRFFYRISSDKDSHFTGALAQYAKEDENLENLLANKIRIVGLNLEAKQQLHFWIILWSKDTFDNTDLDEDTFVAAVECDLPSYGIQPGSSGQYYISLEDVNIDYEDEDETKELHVSLYNADSTSKSSGASGEIRLEFIYELAG